MAIISTFLYFLQLCITIKQFSATDLSKMVFLASFLALSSPLVNPFIYFLMWKRYRQALVQMAETMTCRHHRGEWKDKRIDFGGNYTLSEAIESLSGRFT